MYWTCLTKETYYNHQKEREQAFTVMKEEVS